MAKKSKTPAPPVKDEARDTVPPPPPKEQTTIQGESADLPDGSMATEPTAAESIGEPQPAADGPGIDQVIRRLSERLDEPLPPSYRPRLQEVRLSPEQAETAVRLHRVLSDLGVNFRRVGDVYGWLLDQVRRSASA